MIRRHLVAYCTILLIFFQSFAAVASLLDFHVVNPEHLQQEHQHSLDHQPSSIAFEQFDNSQKMSSEQHNPSDCHHCGHCQGTHAQWLGQQLEQKMPLTQHSHQFSYLKILIDGPVSQPLRPPKY